MAWVYEYDRGGNMTAKKRYSYKTGTLGTVQQKVTYTYGDSNWKDKLTALTGEAMWSTFPADYADNLLTRANFLFILLIIYARIFIGVF